MYISIVLLNAYYICICHTPTSKLQQLNKDHFSKERIYTLFIMAVIQFNLILDNESLVKCKLVLKFNPFYC